MNCKPGELALLVHAEAIPNPFCRGVLTLVKPTKLVRVVKLVPIPEGWPPVWEIETPFQSVAQCSCGSDPHPIIILGLSDANLIPIRDPGEGATDETLINNPVKKPEEVT